MLIDYNMSRDYCSDWTATDAIREIVQNALDSGQNYECDILEKEISVLTKNTVLSPRVFSMGVSEKSEGAIGKYGEGFKIAMLVLTRLGHNPLIFTGNYTVSGLFKEHEFTGVETFCLRVEDSYTVFDGTQFVCSSVNIDVEDVQSKILPFTIKDMAMPDKVDIWQDRPGEIFVNGLFVTKADLVFGYNFAPSNIDLNRDRNMVGGLYWQLAQYYGELGASKAELLFNLVERDAPDVQDLSYWLDDNKLKAELAKLFFNKYGDGVKISKPGTSYFGGHGSVSVSSSASRVYSKCGIKEAKKAIDPDAPDQVLTDWREANKSKLRRDLRKSLDKVITRSKGWKKADIM